MKTYCKAKDILSVLLQGLPPYDFYYLLRKKHDLEPEKISFVKHINMVWSIFEEWSQGKKEKKNNTHISGDICTQV